MVQRARSIHTLLEGATLRCSGTPMHARVEVNAARPRRRAFVVLVLIAVAIAVSVGAWAHWRHSDASARANPPAPPIPVTVSEAARRDVPIFLDGLGTIQASN